MSRFLRAALVVAAVLVAVSAEAASLKICWDAGSVTTSVATLQVFADDAPLYPDVLAGSVLEGAKRCATKPFPASLVRGVDTAITLKAANALGEVGQASNAVTFRAPTIPAAVTGVTVSALAGP